MQLYDKESFVSHGKTYEIRIVYDENKINVVPFYNHYPANGYRYQVHLSKKSDSQDFLKNHGVENLMSHLKHDIEHCCWDSSIT